MPLKYRIQAFANLPGKHEVVGLGRIRLPRAGAVEAEIEVSLAPRRPDGSFDLQVEPVTRHVGCGQFALVPIGSVWENAMRVRDPAESTLLAKVTASSFETLSSPVPNERDRRDTPLGAMEGAPCFAVKLTDVVSTRPSTSAGSSTLPHFALVPSLLLPGGLFGVHSTLLLEMMDGVVDPSISPDRGLFDRTRSMVGPEGRVRIFTRFALDHSTSVVIAAYLTDARLKRCYDSVSTSLYAQQDYREHRPAFARPDWPFKAGCTWRLGGRLMMVSSGAGQPQRRFLITRIESMAFDLAFNEIDVHREGLTTRPAVPVPPSASRQPVGAVERISLGTGRPAGRSRRASVILHPGLDLPQDAGVRVQVIREDVTERPAPSPVGEDPKEEAPGSTAGREVGGSSKARRVIVKKGSPRPSEAQLDEAHASLKERLSETRVAVGLAAVENGWSILDLSGSWERALGDPPLLLVELGTEKGAVMVADGGSVDRDNRSLGILVIEGGAGATDGGVSAVRRLAAQSDGHWRGKQLDGFRIRASFRPGAVWGEPKLYADFVSRAVRAALRPPS